jgi:hypothetical protein
MRRKSNEKGIGTGSGSPYAACISCLRRRKHSRASGGGDTPATQAPSGGGTPATQAPSGGGDKPAPQDTPSGGPSDETLSVASTVDYGNLNPLSISSVRL